MANDARPANYTDQVPAGGINFLLLYVDFQERGGTWERVETPKGVVETHHETTQKEKERRNDHDRSRGAPKPDEVTP